MWTRAVGPDRHGRKAGSHNTSESYTGVWAFVWQHGKLTDLGVPEGCAGWGRALNDRGDVVGTVARPGAERPVLCSEGTTMDLPVPGQGPGVAQDVNDRREVVGYFEHADTGNPHACLWRRGELTDLGVPAGYYLSSAEFISERGDILGHADR
ncbi:hypothetical protein RKE29_05040 [Streptomyces sp. B1866]|uniref:hypothetical protein n=1 Tax=Streptomyces sp. B1866 TaxID=3075431 RepID=UPI00288C9FDD|nr:hypothetical protein [Streptomyces sp. B1866]MDT3396014.1 hypothetical protein [Streptomyces sp. B1866]